MPGKLVPILCDMISAGFYRFVVAPLLEEWHRFLDTPLSHSMMGHLRGNQTRWEALLQQELAEETRTEISEAEELPEVELETEIEAEVDAGESRRASVCSLATGDRVSQKLI